MTDNDLVLLDALLDQADVAAVIVEVLRRRRIALDLEDIPGLRVLDRRRALWFEVYGSFMMERLDILNREHHTSTLDGTISHPVPSPPARALLSLEVDDCRIATWNAAGSVKS